MVNIRKQWLMDDHYVPGTLLSALQALSALPLCHGVTDFYSLEAYSDKLVHYHTTRK